MSYEGTPVQAPPSARRRMMPPMPQQSSHSSTDETQWQAEMEAIAHMFSSLDFETQWTTVAAALVHQKLSLPCRRWESELAMSGWRRWVTHSSVRSKRAFFARQTLRTEFLSWIEQAKSRRSGRLLCFWHNWTSRRPLTTSNTPLRPQRCNTKKGIRAVALGTQQVVDPERRCCQLGGDHRSQTHLFPAGSPAGRPRVVCNVFGCF